MSVYTEKKKTNWYNIGIIILCVIVISVILITSLCNFTKDTSENFTFEVSKDREKCMNQDVTIGKSGCCGKGMNGHVGKFEMNPGNWPDRPDVPVFKQDDKESYNENMVGNQAKNLGLILFTMNGCGHCVDAKENIEQSGLQNDINIMDAQNIEKYDLQEHIRGFPAWYSPVTEKFAMGNMPIETVIERLSHDDMSGVDMSENETPQNNLIILYVQQGCPYCEDAKRHISSNGYQNHVLIKDSSELAYASPSVRRQISGFPAWTYNDNVQLGFGSSSSFPMIRNLLFGKERYIENQLVLNPTPEQMRGTSSKNGFLREDAIPIPDNVTFNSDNDSVEITDDNRGGEFRIEGGKDGITKISVIENDATYTSGNTIRLQSDKMNGDITINVTDNLLISGEEVQNALKGTRLYYTDSCQHSTDLLNKLATLYRFPNRNRLINASRNNPNPEIINYSELDDADKPEIVTAVPMVINIGEGGEASVLFTGNKDLSEIVPLSTEKLEPQYYKYGEYINENNKKVYPLKSACGGSGTVERYQPGVIQSGCPYKNPGGYVGIPSV